MVIKQQNGHTSEKTDMERKKMLDAENTITSLKDSILKLKELL